MRVAFVDRRSRGIAAEPEVTRVRRKPPRTCSSRRAGMTRGRGRGRLPKAGHVVGAAVVDRRHGLARDDAARPPRRAHACHRLQFESMRAPAAGRAAEGDPPAPRSPGRIGRGVRAGRSAAHPDHSDARVRSRGPAHGRAERRGRHAVRPLGRVHRAVQRHRSARVQHPGRVRRRPARWAAGGGATPPRSARASRQVRYWPRPGRGRKWRR